jgi:hypothetical protein
MSMDYSEFLRQLGADPHNRDPEFLSALQSGPEFQQAAEEARAFEDRLTRATELPMPENLLADITALSRKGPGFASRWKPMALAAGILIAVGAAGISWKMNYSPGPVDEYLVAHYHHDGASLIDKAGTQTDADVQAIFSRVGAQAMPALAGAISVIKHCPTPDGKGIHMVLNTEEGLLTLIYMPETKVSDLEEIAFDNMHALLVDLEKGSAIIIGTDAQSVSGLYAFVQESIVPASQEA